MVTIGEETVGEKVGSVVGVSDLSLNSTSGDHGDFQFGQSTDFGIFYVVVGKDRSCGVDSLVIIDGMAGKDGSCGEDMVKDALSKGKCAFEAFKESCDGGPSKEAFPKDLGGHVIAGDNE